MTNLSLRVRHNRSIVPLQSFGTSVSTSDAQSMRKAYAWPPAYRPSSTGV
jgi:hypothetical protein